jgi:hypothetical protein
MATLEQRGNRFRVIFRYGKKRYAAALDADDRETAESLLAEVGVVLRKEKKGLLDLPAGADVARFVLSGGQVTVRANTPPAPTAASAGPGLATGPEPTGTLTLGPLRDRYVRTLGNGAVEANTLRTIRIHFGHWVATLGADFPIGRLTRQHPQAHIDRRAAGYHVLWHGQKGYNGVAVRARTGGRWRWGGACPATRTTSRAGTWRPPSAASGWAACTCRTGTRHPSPSSTTHCGGSTAWPSLPRSW